MKSLFYFWRVVVDLAGSQSASRIRITKQINQIKRVDEDEDDEEDGDEGDDGEEEADPAGQKGREGRLCRPSTASPAHPPAQPQISLQITSSSSSTAEINFFLLRSTGCLCHRTRQASAYKYFFSSPSKPRFSSSTTSSPASAHPLPLYFRSTSTSRREPTVKMARTKQTARTCPDFAACPTSLTHRR